MTTNDAAERLRGAAARMMAEDVTSGTFMAETIDAALAAERRATVERIRAAAGPLPQYEGDIVPVLEAVTRLLDAIDAEAER